MLPNWSQSLPEKFRNYFLQEHDDDNGCTYDQIRRYLYHSAAQKILFNDELTCFILSNSSRGHSYKHMQYCRPEERDVEWT